MLKQIKLLSAVQLVNLFGWNEVRYTKDKGKRINFLGLGAVWLMLLIMLAGYVAVLSYGYVISGMAEIIPGYLFTITSLLMLFFTFFKSGSVIFNMKSYEMTMSFPVSESAIVISRFFTMYVTNFFLGLLIMIPGLAVYGIYMHPTGTFYLFGFLGIVLLPLLPLTIATALSAGIMALTARMRHKSLISALLMIILVLAALVVSISISGGTMQNEVMMETIMKNLAAEINQQLGQIYPPALWFQDVLLYGKVVSFLLLALVSVGLFVLLIIMLQKNFLAVCTALNTVQVKNNYKMQNLVTSSVIKALWKKEGKRYFASSIYVSNTMIGYIIMDVMAVALFAVGSEKLEHTLQILQIPGILEKGMPLMLGLTAIIMPITSCSISMEGKHKWLLQTLPIKSRDIWNGKILLNLSIAGPFYLIAVLFSILALKPSLTRIIWLVVIPAIYILFSSIAGITINLAMPIFNWENETRVVKQSASIMVTMLVDFLSILPPFICILQGVSADLVYLTTTVLLLIGTGILYWRNAQKTIMD